MEQMRKLTVAPEDAGARLDRFLAENFAISRSAIERMLEDGEITVNGGTAAKNYRLRGGEEIVLMQKEPEPTEAIPENIPLDIVYEDENV